MKSSTHFRIGLRPFAHSKSTSASPNSPKSPPDVAPPKLLLVLRANLFGLLEVCTATPAH